MTTALLLSCPAAPARCAVGPGSRGRPPWASPCAGWLYPLTLLRAYPLRPQRRPRRLCCGPAKWARTRTPGPPFSGRPPADAP